MQRNFYNKQQLYEIYTYGEQVVVMPVRDEEKNPLKNMAEQQLSQIIKKYTDADVRVEIHAAKPTYTSMNISTHT